MMDDRSSTTPNGAVAASLTPQQIGPYKILDPLGEGGMGEAYKAKRRFPIAVALGDQDKFAEAEPLMQATLAIRGRRFGPRAAPTTRASESLAKLRQQHAQATTLPSTFSSTAPSR